jgi:hypothetical protein
MNLASIGFLIVGILFVAYAYTFYVLAEKKLPAFLKNYAYAYFALAVAFLFWSFAAFSGSFLSASVLVGDILLLLGSLFLVSVIFKANKSIKIIAIVVGVILSAVFVYMRLYYFPPTPFISNGILIFNTQKIIAEILGFVFAFVWLPANLFVAKEVSKKMEIQGMFSIYSFIYIISTVSAILFISVSTTKMVIASFVILGLCFVMLLFSNYVISKVLSEDFKKGSIPKKPQAV